MSRNCIKCCVNNRTGPDLLCDACRAKQQQAPDADGAGRKPVIVQSPYREIRTEHTFSRKEFTGDEPRPLCPGWNHGDGPPDWRNSGWGYDGVLYACTHDSPESAKLYRQLNHQYAIDFEVWALARLAAAEAKAREAEAATREAQRVGRKFADEADRLRGFEDICRRLDKRFGCGHTDHGAEDAENLLRHVDELQEQVAAAEAARDAAVGLLDDVKEYIRHADDCTPDDCTCGVRKLIERVDAALAAPPAVAAAAQDTTNGEANART